MNWSSVLKTPTNRLDTGSPKVYHMPRWSGYGDPKRLDVIARIAESRGRDPSIATLAVCILRGEERVWGQGAGLPVIQPRDYKGQAARLLKWVQEKIYYVNEPGERLQDPLYTLKVAYGDCDDMTILLYSLCRSIRLPVKLVICGVDRRKRKVRYHQGDVRYPRGVEWSHIYMAVGNDPFQPTSFAYAEPTIKGAPLGWDVVGAHKFNIPELAGYGSAVAGSMAELVLSESAKPGQGHVEPDSFLGLNWKSIFAAAFVGALVSVSSKLISDSIDRSLEAGRKRAEKDPPKSYVIASGLVN
jgi:hypothetical protein